MRRKRHRHSPARAKQSDPGCADRSKVWLARRMAPGRHPGCPGAPPANVRGAFNAHNPGDGGSGLVQPVFRSPARIPSAESTRKGLCDAPPSEKRYTFKRKTLYVIMREISRARGGDPTEELSDGCCPVSAIRRVANKDCWEQPYPDELRLATVACDLSRTASVDPRREPWLHRATRVRA